jgi:predicted permease
MDAIYQDVRYALRQLTKYPAFTSIAVITLALGIGANTAIFSVVNSILLKPLPYKDADQLVMMWEQNPHRGWYENIVSGDNFRDWRKQNRVFTDIAAFESNFFTISGQGRSEEIAGERVSTNLFSLLGVQPLEGRLFLPEEEIHGRDAVILSYGLWQQRYGADPQIVGKQILLNGENYPVVGILPASFRDDYSASFAQHSKLWISGLEPFAEGRTSHAYHAIARLGPGVTLAQAQANMDSIANQIDQQYPEATGWGVGLVRLHDQVVEYARPTLLVLSGAVGLVLLIACANVANLLLVRATGRRRETAIRNALGASRGRIVQQFLTESVLLALAGAVAGLALAPAASRILVFLSPPDAAPFEGRGLNLPVLLFTFALAIGTGVVFGLAPALGNAQENVSESLQETGRTSSGGGRDRRLRDLLVIGEFGLSLALLVSAGLMIKALTHLRRVDIGFNPDHLLTLKVPLEGPRYKDPEKQVAFFHELLSRIQALPGVESVGLSRGIPMLGWAGWGFVVDNNPHPTPGEVPDANYVVVSPDYFRTMQIPMLQGQGFTESNSNRSEPVAIVSESLSRKYWPGQNPLGRRLKISGDGDDKTQPWRVVVGVAGNVRTEGQYAPLIPEIYVPYTQYPWVLFPRNILVRTAGTPLSIVPQIREQLAGLDKDVPISDIAMMKEIAAGPVQEGESAMWLLSSLAGLALVLSGVGIYSVISYSVSQRTKEIGIRMAMGASHAKVERLVVKQGLLLTAIGLALGLLAAFGISRVFASLPFRMRWMLLFDVRPNDPLILGAVSAVLTAVAVLACFVPARRAAKVDPMVALRYE